MTDAAADSARDEDAGPRQGREATTGMPRWAKVFAAIALVLVVLVLLMLLVGGGKHGPGRHVGSKANTSVGHR